MRDEDFMRMALDQAREDGSEIPVGAVVVKDGRAIASAHNGREKGAFPFAHAELTAMSLAAEALGTRRLAGCTVYVTLEPCPMCAGAMVLAGIERCVFAAFDPRMGCAGSLYDLLSDPALPCRVKAEGGLMAEESLALLRGFFGTKRDQSDIS